ncbi:hypothetical protein Glove_346g109 [Diversispora epigaea]|uniref:Uncharacterized protein n=1 Tax=Diversispora epigaea TaxID=1348612 RepID=A0A397HFS5_9GLOM|nr:hypothetical protein Glove_346g109 [Diversispora epigaea]
MNILNFLIFFVLSLLPFLGYFTFIKTSVLTPPPEPVKKGSGKGTLVSFENFEDDLKWVTHTHCEEQGSSCGGSLSQEVTSGVFIIEKGNADLFSTYYFSYLDKGSRVILSSVLNSLFYTEGLAFTHKYIDLNYGKGNTDKPITGAFYFMNAKGSGEKRTVFISLARLSKKPVRGYYFLKDYYEGNEDRVENALKYMIYKDANSKGLIEN